MDGVIFDSERLYMECFEEAGKALGLKNVTEPCLRCIGVTANITKAILTEAFQDESLAERFQEKAASLFREKTHSGLLEIKPGVAELLSVLKQRHCKTALASSTKTEIVLEELKAARLLPFFDVILGGDHAAHSKPSPDIFLKAAELLKERPDNCIVIEDSYNGIRAAKAAGMTAVMVPDLLPPTDEIRLLADYIVPSLPHILQIYDTD